jgi:hypothetical protein
LPAGPGRAIWRLSNLRPGPLRNLGAMAPRPDSGSRPARPGEVARIRRLAARTHRLRPVARSVHHLCGSQAPDTGNDRAPQNPISFADGAHRGPKRLSLSEQGDTEVARGVILSALKAGRKHRAHRDQQVERISCESGPSFRTIVKHPCRAASADAWRRAKGPQVCNAAGVVLSRPITYSALLSSGQPGL